MRLKSNLSRNLIATGFALTASTTLSGAAFAQQVLQVMHQGDPGWAAAFEGVASRFEAANPGIDVEMIHSTHDEYNEKLSASIAAGTMPDIVELDAPFLANYVWSGHLQPIEGLVDAALVDDLTASGRSQGIYPIDGKLYAIGLTDSSVMLYGNRKYLDKIGARIPKGVADSWTRAEFEDILAKLDALDEVKWPIDTFRGYGIKTEWITYAYEPLLISAGCDIISRETWTAGGTLDSPACVDAMTMMQSWMQKDWVVPMSAGNNQFYADGAPAALAWGGNWIYAEAKPVLGDDLVVIPLPNFGNGTKSPNGTWIWGISAKSDTPELAGQFVNFMLTDKDYRAYQVEKAGFPGMKSFAAESPLYAEGGPMQVAVEQAAMAAVPRAPHPAYPVLTNTFMEAVDEIFNGGDVQEALTKAAEKIDEEIADNDGFPPFSGN
jgi:multiple sugar transport system substrate-binding protein